MSGRLYSDLDITFDPEFLPTYLMPDQPTMAELMHNANVNVKEKSDQDYILQFLKGEQIRYYHTTKFDNWF